MGSDCAPATALRRRRACTSLAAVETARSINRVPAPLKMMVVLKPDGGSNAVLVSRPLAAGVLSPAATFAPLAAAGTEEVVAGPEGGNPVAAAPVAPAGALEA